VHIRSGDIVQVMTGVDKGKRGKVLRVLPKVGKLVVEGCNRVYKHVKPSRRNPQGGRLSKEMPMDASNVMALCPQTNKPTRVGVRYLPDGSKERFARRSGTSLGGVAPARKAHAGKS